MIPAKSFYRENALTEEEFQAAINDPHQKLNREDFGLAVAFKVLGIAMTEDWALSGVKPQELSALLQSYHQTPCPFPVADEQKETCAKAFLIIRKAEQAVRLGLKAEDNPFAEENEDHQTWKNAYHRTTLYRSDEYKAVYDLDLLRSHERVFSDPVPERAELDTNPFPENSYAAHLFVHLRSRDTGYNPHVQDPRRDNSEMPLLNIEKLVEEKRATFSISKSWTLIFNAQALQLFYPADIQAQKPKGFQI